MPVSTADVTRGRRAGEPRRIAPRKSDSSQIAGVSATSRSVSLTPRPPSFGMMRWRMLSSSSFGGLRNHCASIPSTSQADSLTLSVALREGSPRHAAEAQHVARAGARGCARRARRGRTCRPHCGGEDVQRQVTPQDQAGEQHEEEADAEEREGVPRVDGRRRRRPARASPRLDEAPHPGEERQRALVGGEEPLGVVEARGQAERERVPCWRACSRRRAATPVRRWPCRG